MVSDLCSDTYVVVGVDGECADDDVLRAVDLADDLTLVSDVTASQVHTLKVEQVSLSP